MITPGCHGQQCASGHRAGQQDKRSRNNLLTRTRSVAFDLDYYLAGIGFCRASCPSSRRKDNRLVNKTQRIDQRRPDKSRVATIQTPLIHICLAKVRVVAHCPARSRNSLPADQNPAAIMIVLKGHQHCTHRHQCHQCTMT
eukprot:scaffold44894_cov31-Prasinocladus_malaysianus.AAC.1